MPADLVTGDDLDDVATYVASVAGVPGIEPPKAPGGPGGQVYAQNGCGSCHTLKAAGSSGTTGPDLDKVLRGQSAAEVEKSITDPNAKITPGFPPVMPETFGQSISPQDLKLLINFLLSSAGKG
jgi:mono/diheme cytochrome c family protein